MMYNDTCMFCLIVFSKYLRHLTIFTKKSITSTKVIWDKVKVDLH